MLDHDRYAQFEALARKHQISRAQAVLVEQTGLYDRPQQVCKSVPLAAHRPLAKFGTLLDQLSQTNWKDVEIRSREEIPHSGTLADILLSDEIEQRVNNTANAFSIAARMSFVASRWEVEPTGSNIEALGKSREVDVIAEAAGKAAHEIVNQRLLAQAGYDFPYSTLFLFNEQQSRDIIGVNLVDWATKSMTEKLAIARRRTTKADEAVQGLITIGTAISGSAGGGLLAYGIPSGDMAATVAGTGLIIATLGGFYYKTRRFRNKFSPDEQEKLGL
jgi:hypothetical protein